MLIAIVPGLKRDYLLYVWHAWRQSSATNWWADRIHQQTGIFRTHEDEGSIYPLGKLYPPMFKDIFQRSYQTQTS